MIPYLTIGNLYYYDNKVQSGLNETDQFLAVFSDIKHITQDNIVYIPVLLQDDQFLNHLKDYQKLNDLKNILGIFKSKLTALIDIKPNINDYHKFIDVYLLQQVYTALSKALMFLYETKSMPKDYQYLKYAYLISEYIASNTILFRDKKEKIRFNPFTAYGRFGLKSGSFNILSLMKEKRIYVKPENTDYIFCEFDFNAFEIRTLFALLKIKQPEDDLYEVLFSLEKNHNHSRFQYKQLILKSIYSQHEDITILGSLLKHKKFYSMYPIMDSKVTNIFGKVMDTDHFHLLSRILQSSAAYILYQQMYKLLCYIKQNNLKSKISFSIHDSICLSIHKSETDKIDIFKDIIENMTINELNYNDKFPVIVKTGTNYGELRRYD